MKKKLMIYGIGTFFSKILVFLMVPIYTRLFSTSDYGYYDVVISDIQMLISISCVEIWSGILRFMYTGDKKEIPIKCYLQLCPVMFVVYSLLMFVLSHYITIKYPVIVFAYGILYLFYTVGNTICRGYGKNIDYVLSGLIYTLVSSVISILFSLKLEFGIKGLFYAQCIGYLTSIVYIEIKTKAYQKALKMKSTRHDIENILEYSLPLMLNSFSFLFLGTYNKNIILKQLGEYESGLYAFVLKFSAIFSIIISIYSLAWQEQAFSVSNEKDNTQIYEYYVNKFLKVVGFATPCFIFGVYFFAPFIGGSSYIDSNKYIALSISATFISEVSGVLSVIIAVYRKTFQTFISTFIGAVVNVILAQLLIVKLGVNGSSIALNAGFLVAAMLRYLFVKIDIKFKLNVFYICFYFIEVVAFIICVHSTNTKLLLFYGGAVLVIWFVWMFKDLKIILNEIVSRIRRKEK